MIHKAMYSIIKPKSKDEDNRRREFILNVLLAVTIFLLASSALMTTIKRVLFYVNPEDVIPLGVIYLVLFLFSILYLLSRKGYFIFSSYTLIAIYFTLSSYIIHGWGIEGQAPLLFFVLIIVLSGVLINARFSFIAAFLAFFVLASVFYLQEKNIIHPNLGWKNDPWGWMEIIVVTIIFLIIATVSWLSNREIEKSLKRARKSEANLKEERDMLEIRVERRTKELQKTQMEKMAQVYKFAEFGRLSSGLFHDLINPLNAVSLNIEKIKNTSYANENFKEVEEDLERTMKATEHMKDFIHSIKKQIVHEDTSELFSINQEIKGAIDVLKYRSRKNNVKILFKSEKEIQTFGSSIKFNQVMVNLINNAIDAYSNINQDNQDTIRKVKIKLTEENKIVRISISDYGEGIPTNLFDKIFEPFFTTKDFKRGDSGTGIGLSLTKRIIEKDFKGKIKVASEENKGTKFIIKFSINTPHNN